MGSFTRAISYGFGSDLTMNTTGFSNESSRPVTTETPDILKKIVEVERKDLERRRADAPQGDLERRVRDAAHPPPLNLAGALMGDETRVIAEVKRATPSKGVLRGDIDAAALASTYADNGAAAISVLTNGPFFQGSLEDMESVHGAVRQRQVPVLRKDFLFDPYQVLEARARGADAVLLIVAMLSPVLISELMDAARKLWMPCLVEVHTEGELETALSSGAEIVGINNRDLHTFVTDLEVTERLAPKIPADRIVVSESGISSRNDVARVASSGAHAILVGEALVTSDDPGARLRELA